MPIALDRTLFKNNKEKYKNYIFRIFASVGVDKEEVYCI